MMKTTPLRVATAAIALSVLVAFGSPPPHLFASAADDEKFVTCGSAIKLTHVESGRRFLLQSDERQLQSGSGQQLVTAEEDNRSPRGLWQVREGHGSPACEVGRPIRCGEVVRLTHVTTQANLHTHAIRSPLSNQHEVSCFGEGGEGDSGDDWRVECDGATRNRALYWVRDAPIQLRSAATNRWLGASSAVKFTESNCGRGCPIMNHLEVFGREGNDPYSHWTVQFGVHLSK
jgi:hypothetical protein